MQSHPFLHLPSLSLSFSHSFSRLTATTKTPSPFLCLYSSSASSSFSISDADLQSRGFSVRLSPSGLDLDALNDVFARVGFPRRDPAKIRRALDHASGAVVWLASSAAGGKPVAFARATGDGVFNAVVWDVVVEPSYQGIGLGKAVMERIVAELREKGVGNIALYAEPRVVAFYRPLGFVADPDGIRGMVYSRKNKKR
ncbi:serotonin N-acetyltransferase 2, chloroplastic [Typha angustifolia]|uniref:serotonin N-acetyltransferase 2, chloroplastic n=1 Tax=Typha angustifolia TaxID=59011 RepID=UPI003C2E7DE6